MNDVTIENHVIGDNQPVFVIGEIGLNHNGDVEIAKRLVDVSVETGVNCVKLQKRNVDGLAIQSVMDAEDLRFPDFGNTYRKVREHIEFSREEYVQVIDYCNQKGITFLCTAFDVPSIEFLESLNVSAYKVASHTVTNLPVLRRLAEIKKPVIISSGMCNYEELDRAINILKEGGVPTVLMHCVSSYPTPIEECNLKMINILKQRYDIPVGYSGHEMGYWPTAMAVAAGAQAIERHITLDSKMVGFDHKLSVEPKILRDMVAEIRKVEVVLGNGEKFVSEKEQITRDKYHVSIASAVEIKEGDEITENMIEFKNPGTGIPPSRISEVVNRKAKVDIPKDTLVTFDMVG